MHLLVIEDERVLCETIVRSLRRLAYSVDRSAAGCGYSDRRKIQRAIIVPVFGERREDGWRISRRGIGIKEIFAR